MEMNEVQWFKVAVNCKVANSHAHMDEAPDFVNRELSKLSRPLTDISDFSALDNIVERFHDLLWFGLFVHSVDLEYVNVGAQPPDAGIYGVHDMFSAETMLVDKF